MSDPTGADDSTPLLSICIPNYSRTAQLLKAIESFARQSFRDFEVCISEGRPEHPDEPLIQDTLEASGLRYHYQRGGQRLRYDQNLRAAIGLARGRWCLLMGNDDALNGVDALASLAELLDDPELGYVITNFCDDRSGELAERVLQDRRYAGGIDTVCRLFRNVSFVSGLAVRRDLARAVASDEVDGSEMYQMYLLARVVGSGAALLQSRLVLVRKDIHISESFVESYRDEVVKDPWQAGSKWRPMLDLARVVVESMERHLRPGPSAGNALNVLAQLTVFTYSFWITNYREVFGFRYAAAFALRTWPPTLLSGRKRWVGWLLVPVWAPLVASALLVPLALFERLRRRLYRFAKRVGA